jgi:hypothetical protein
MANSPTKTTEDRLTDVVAEIRRLVGSLYFELNWELPEFRRLINDLAYASARETWLLQRLIIELGPDEARLLAALRRAYQVQVEP